MHLCTKHKMLGTHLNKLGIGRIYRISFCESNKKIIVKLDQKGVKQNNKEKETVMIHWLIQLVIIFNQARFGVLNIREGIFQDVERRI